MTLAYQVYDFLMRNKWYVLTVAMSSLFLIIILNYVQISAASGSSGQSQGGDINVQVSYWKDRIKAVGGKVAYEEFARSVESLKPEAQHVAAHTFGFALYDVEGVKGLSVCDSRFSYGCSHEFNARAIFTLGTAAIPELAQACRDAFGTLDNFCAHGIGHGILAYVGYSLSDVNKGLDLCKKSFPYSALYSQDCYRGVFMEYSIRPLADSIVRQPPDQDYLDPCDKISGTYQLSCIIFQPEWWHQLLSKDGLQEPAVYQRMGELCDESSPKALRDECYLGIGRSMIHDIDFEAGSDPTPKEGIALCIATSKNVQDQLICRSSAAFFFFLRRYQGTFEQRHAQAVAFCTGLNNKDLQYCDQYASANPVLLKDVLQNP